MTIPKIDLSSSAFKSNPVPTLSRLRQEGPLVKKRVQMVGEVWVTTNYESTVSVLREKDLFVVEPRNAGRRNIAGMKWWMPQALRSLTNNMLGKDEPDHRRLRKLVDSAFVRQSIEQIRPRIAALVDIQLDQLENEAGRNNGQVDFIEHFARPFPLAVISELLGLPEEDRAKFSHWASSFTTVSSAFGMLKAIPSIWKINDYLWQQFELCREQPRPGMISALVSAEQEGNQLSKDELLASAFLLLIAGHETTVHLLNLGLSTLLAHSDQKRKLCADWSKAGDAVDEILRFTSPLQMTKPRYVSQDVEMSGQPLKRGEVVIPFLAAANNDPEKFKDPERFDITRSPNQHLSFGTGTHVCLGLKLAKAEVEIALEKILTRFPELSLSINDTEIEWWDRIGVRSMKQLPLSLANTAQVPKGVRINVA